MPLRKWMNAWLLLLLPFYVVLPLLFYQNVIIPRGRTVSDILASIALLVIEHMLVYSLFILVPHANKLSDKALLHFSWLLPWGFGCLFMIVFSSFFSLELGALAAISSILVGYGVLVPFHIFTFSGMKMGWLKWGE